MEDFINVIDLGFESGAKAPLFLVRVYSKKLVMLCKYAGDWAKRQHEGCKHPQEITDNRLCEAYFFSFRHSEGDT